MKIKNYDDPNTDTDSSRPYLFSMLVLKFLLICPHAKLTMSVNQKS